MQIVKQQVELLAMTADPLRLIEAAGRTCYKSEEKITAESAKSFVEMIIKRGHDSVLEHASMTVRITTDRGISHEIVRHRIGMSYSQESTRYVKYGDIRVIDPELSTEVKAGTVASPQSEWLMAMKNAEKSYKYMLDAGVAPQWARSVLPNSLATEIVVTGNFRAWRHFIALRSASGAHPQIHEIAKMIEELMPC